MSSLLRRIPSLAVCALVSMLAGTVAHAAQLSCQVGALTLDVVVDPSAGTCAVDGQRAMLRKPHNPVVCHVSDPRLRILTIGQDGSFTWEETDSARVFQGTCVRS
ncbi:MAG: hypothetical protein AAGJ91_18230 [Pseudomonadota bacterium]